MQTKSSSARTAGGLSSKGLIPLLAGLCLTALPLHATLVLHVPFNGNPEDGVGSNDLTLGGNTLPTYGTGQFGQAIQFNGGDQQHAERASGSHGLPSGNAVRTLSVWANLADTSAGIFAGYGNRTINQFFGMGTHWNNGGNLMFFGFAGGDIDTGEAATTGSWQNYVVTLTPGVTNSLVSIYRDGGLIAAEERALGTSSGTQFIESGRQGGDNSRVLNGSVDDFAIWDTALSTGKIKSISSLGMAAGLNYDAGQVNSMFTAFDAQTSVSIGGRDWFFTNSALGDTGDLTSSNGDYWVNFDAGLGMTTIPEPGTLLLVGIALGSLLVFRRKR